MANFCTNCGSEVTGQFCPNCGKSMEAAQPQQQGGYGYNQQPQGGYGYNAPVRTGKGPMRTPTGVMLILNMAFVVTFGFIMAGVLASEYSGSANGVGALIVFLMLHVGACVYGIIGSLGSAKPLHSLLSHAITFTMFIVALIVMGSVTNSVYSYYSGYNYSSLGTLIGSTAYMISWLIGCIFWLLGLIFSIIATVKGRHYR